MIGYQNVESYKIFEMTKNLLDLKDIILRGFYFSPLNWSKYQFPLFSIITLLFSSTLIVVGGEKFILYMFLNYFLAT